MTTNERLAEAETDLEHLVQRCLNALPTLRRAVEDVTDWRHDIRKELCDQLEKATHRAHENQLNRRRLPANAPLHIQDMLHDVMVGDHPHETPQPESETKNGHTQTPPAQT